MSRPRTVVFDNEAVQAALSTTHPKHRELLSMIEVITRRSRRRVSSVALVVPTTVRVEAGWEHGAPGAAPINRLRVVDAPLGSTDADKAVRLRSSLGLSVVDAHVAAVMQSAPAPVTVVTSDVDDMVRVVGRLGLDATVVRV